MFSLKSALLSLIGPTRQEGRKARLTWMEIELLLKFWATFLYRVETTLVDNGDAYDYALSRLGYFGQFLGDEKVREILEDVYDGFNAPDEVERDVE
jgi:hypothetical protein